MVFPDSTNKGFGNETEMGSSRSGNGRIWVRPPRSRAETGVPSDDRCIGVDDQWLPRRRRSEEHTSELQSLMRISYAVFCLKKKKTYMNYTDSQIYTDKKLH